MFSKRLREERMRMKFTQQNVADLLSISLNAYQKYEQGTRAPSLDTLVKLADLLNVSTDYLLGRDEFLRSLAAYVDEHR